MSIYTGIKKRWIEGDYAGSYIPGEDGIEIRSPLFLKYLGKENLKIQNVGFYNDLRPKPLMITTDLLMGKLDPLGQQVPNETNGLYYPDMGESAEPTIKPLEMLLKRARNENLLTIFPGDQHENSKMFNPNALTTTILDKDLNKLSQRERDIVNKKYSRWIGKRIPAGVWKDIFMKKNKYNPRGDFQGKEERNFLPHCTENIVEYLPFVLELFNEQKKIIMDQVSQGVITPNARFIPVPKDGLTVDMPGDERGMNGNKFDEILKAAYTGDYFQGDEHRHKKIAIVVGACYEYSVRLLIEHLIDADINVLCILSATKGLDLFSSKPHTTHYLKELYGKKLFFTYDWPCELLGKKPRGWDKVSNVVKKIDEEHHKNWFKLYIDQINKGETSMGQKILENIKIRGI